jgi:hypothetical protein
MSWLESHTVKALLESFSLEHFDVSATGAAVAAFETIDVVNLKDLIWLSLANCQSHVRGKLLSRVMQAPQLTHLDVSFASGITSLNWVPLENKITHINLNGSMVAPGPLMMLEKTFPHLLFADLSTFWFSGEVDVRIKYSDVLRTSWHETEQKAIYHEICKVYREQSTYCVAISGPRGAGKKRMVQSFRSLCKSLNFVVISSIKDVLYLSSLGEDYLQLWKDFLLAGFSDTLSFVESSVRSISASGVPVLIVCEAEEDEAYTDVVAHVAALRISNVVVMFYGTNASKSLAGKMPPSFWQPILLTLSSVQLERIRSVILDTLGLKRNVHVSSEICGAVSEVTAGNVSVLRLAVSGGCSLFHVEDRVLVCNLEELRQIDVRKLCRIEMSESPMDLLRTLGIIALCQTISLNQLSAVTKIPVSKSMEQLSQCTRLGYLEEETISTSSRWRFSCALFRDTALDLFSGLGDIELFEKIPLSGHWFPILEQLEGILNQDTLVTLEEGGGNFFFSFFF